LARQKKEADFWLVAATLGLLTLGIVMVLSSSAYAAYNSFGDTYYYFRRQLIWALLGLVCMFIASHVDYRKLEPLTLPFLGLAVLLLLAVLVIGVTSHGASRWIGFGPLTVQPSEISKLAIVLFFALYLSRAGKNIQTLRGLAPALLVLGAVAGLIMLQPDLGTTIAVALTVFVMLAAAGSTVPQLAALTAAGLVGVAGAIYLEPFRMRRAMAFINPEYDPLGAGFQIIQSILALGSGGLFGVGLGNGKQKLLYVPERHTDFIFAIIGEELGFLGAFLVLALFFILIWRGFRMALKIPDSYGGFLAVGLTSMIGLQALINIGVVSGSLPVTGITLPLVSYGGSSLVLTLVSIGILLNISRHTG